MDTAIPDHVVAQLLSEATNVEIVHEIARRMLSAGELIELGEALQSEYR